MESAKGTRKSIEIRKGSPIRQAYMADIRKRKHRSGRTGNTYLGAGALALMAGLARFLFAAICRLATAAPVCRVSELLRQAGSIGRKGNTGNPLLKDEFETPASQQR